MAQTAGVEKKVWIPEISDGKLEEFSKRIKPVIGMVRVRRTTKKEGGKTFIHQDIGHPKGKLERIGGGSGTPFYIKPVDLRNTAYTWDPKITHEATGLKTLADFRTYHTWAYYGFFKPSIAEVLAQIPEEHLDKVVAFEIIESPETAEDLNREHEALNAGYHVAKTRLYTRE